MRTGGQQGVTFTDTRPEYRGLGDGKVELFLERPHELLHGFQGSDVWSFRTRARQHPAQQDSDAIKSVPLADEVLHIRRIRCRL